MPHHTHRTHQPDQPMLPIPTPVRANDLPPAWDHCPTQWTGWEPTTPPTHHRDTCDHCGTHIPPLLNRGTATHPTHLPSIAPGRIAEMLLASRCRHCHHDQVLVLSTGQLWDLDEDDYTDQGSTNPHEGDRS